jgi:hypothetical protein
MVRIRVGIRTHRNRTRENWNDVNHVNHVQTMTVPFGRPSNPSSAVVQHVYRTLGPLDVRARFKPKTTHVRVVSTTWMYNIYIYIIILLYIYIIYIFITNCSCSEKLDCYCSTYVNNDRVNWYWMIISF